MISKTSKRVQGGLKKEFKKIAFLTFTVGVLLNSFLPSYSNNLNKDMVFVKGGKFAPPYSITKKVIEYPVKSFYLDKTPVTKKQFLDFITSNPKWQKDNIAHVFADENYLMDWKDKNLNTESYNEPVTYVSWFAAKAYCNSKGKRLPTDLEWEYASYDINHTDFSWYWKPFGEKFDNVGLDKADSRGIHNFHNLVWEWTYDFNNSVINTDSREVTGDIQKAEAFCGNTGNFKDNKDYPAFARYSFRGTLKAGTTIKSLGFRCAKDS